MTSKHPRCLAIEADLVATAAGEAAPEAAERVREHVGGGRACAEDLGRDRAVEDVVGRLRTTLDTGTDEGPAPERLAGRPAGSPPRPLGHGVFASPPGPLLLAR